LGFRVGRFEFVRGLFATHDGGVSWESRRSPCPGTASFSAAIDLVTPRLAWVICVGQPAWTSRGRLSVTRDGGDHWTERPNVAEPEVDFGGGGAAFSGGRGFVFLGRGGASPARLLKTTDYGRNWVVVHRWP
jgi:photosystem II stability/assembly factor-like uncharacterized protein